MVRETAPAAVRSAGIFDLFENRSTRGPYPASLQSGSYYGKKITSPEAKPRPTERTQWLGVGQTHPSRPSDPHRVRMGAQRASAGHVSGAMALTNPTNSEIFLVTRCLARDCHRPVYPGSNFCSPRCARAYLTGGKAPRQPPTND